MVLNTNIFLKGNIMFFRNFIRKLLGIKPVEPGKHELDFTERTATRTEPVLGKPMNDHVEATAPTTESKAKKTRAKKVKSEE